MRVSFLLGLIAIVSINMSQAIAEIDIEHVPEDPVRVLVLGDSISAAYGIDIEQGWVTLLQQRAQQQCGQNSVNQVLVNNASVSGETTAGGLARLPALLDGSAQPAPDIVVIELGGNDGLRGLSPIAMRQNLLSMVQQSLAAEAEVVLLGMLIPPNYGEAYVQLFTTAFEHVANETGVAFMPFFLEDVGGNDDLMQADGIHPAANAQPILLDNAWPLVGPMILRKCRGIT